MKQFTFYKLYSDILDGMNDTDAGKFAMRICEYEFEDKLPEEEMSGKERFYWNNISDMLAEIKEAESSGKSLKRYNLRSEHFTFYETYFDAMKFYDHGRELGARRIVEGQKGLKRQNTAYSRIAQPQTVSAVYSDGTDRCTEQRFHQPPYERLF